MKITPVLGINGYKSKDETYPIYIRVNLGQKRKLFPVGAKVKKIDWDEKNGRVKSTYVHAREINLKILDQLNVFEKSYLNLSGDITNLTDPMKVVDRSDFYWWFEERLIYSKKFHGTYNYKKLLSCKKKLQDFRPALKVSQFDYKLLLDYEKHLKGLGNGSNTIADNMTRLKIVVKMIVNSGGLEAHKNPFLNYTAKRDKVSRKRISFDDILKLADLDISGDKQKQLAVDAYLYSFFNAGIRFGDLTRLKVGSVKDGRLVYTMNKTTIDRSIKQSAPALKIYNRHAAGKRPNEPLFDFGVTWRKNDTWEEVSKENGSISAKNALYNKHLKKVCEAVDIEKISFHTSRHSFADYTKSKKFGDKFDIHTLKDLLGHKKVATTEIYMKGFYKENSDLAIEQLFGDDTSNPDVKVNKK